MSRERSHFGRSVERALADRKITASALADTLGHTRSYLSHTMTGRKTASPEWADVIADALGLDGKKRTELHRAAAKDKGFKIDLT